MLLALFRRRRPKAAARPPRARPCLEALEDRIAPAVFTWVGPGGPGGNGWWNNSSNWSRVGADNNNIPDDADDDVVLDWNQWSEFHPFLDKSYSIRSINTKSAFDGHELNLNGYDLTLTGDTDFSSWKDGELVFGGQTSLSRLKVAADHELFLYGGEWTGFNDDPNKGEVVIDGTIFARTLPSFSKSATVGVHVVTAGLLDVGDYEDHTNGYRLNLKDGADIRVNGELKLDQVLVSDSEYTGSIYDVGNNGDSKVYISTLGKVVRPDNRASYQYVSAPVVNEGGIFEVGKSSWVKVNSNGGYTHDEDYLTSYLVLKKDSVMYGTAGIVEGFMEVEQDGNNAASAKFSGLLWLEAPAVLQLGDQTDAVFCTLEVNGSFNSTDATVMASVDAQSNACDRIKSNDFSFWGTSDELSLVETNGSSLPNVRTWGVLEYTGTGNPSGGFDIINAPFYDNGWSNNVLEIKKQGLGGP